MRKSCRVRSTHLGSGHGGAVCALALASVWLALPLPALAEGTEQMVKACFEVKAIRAMENAATPDELTRNLAAMAAGKLCHEAADNAVHACLADVEDGKARRVQTYYRCIGRSANVCIDSKWATDEFRRVVCAGAEEAAWLASFKSDIAAMSPIVAGSADEDLLRRMEETHFAARDATCNLVRHVNEESGPLIGYAACATEMAARAAIDMRVLRRALTSGRPREPKP